MSLTTGKVLWITCLNSIPGKLWFTWWEIIIYISVSRLQIISCIYSWRSIFSRNILNWRTASPMCIRILILWTTHPLSAASTWSQPLLPCEREWCIDPNLISASMALSNRISTLRRHQLLKILLHVGNNKNSRNNHCENVKRKHIITMKITLDFTHRCFYKVEN